MNRFRIAGLLLAVLLGVFETTAARGEGRMLTDTLHSSALDTSRAFQIYLPDGYASGTERYPVVYFLHGLGGDETAYIFFKQLLDSMIAAREIRPLILVKPDASAEPYAGSMYTNSDLYGNFEDYIVKDLVDYVDANYRTEAVRERRVVMGHSMGGYGAFKLGLKHADLFAGLVSHSGFVALEPHEGFLRELLRESGGRPPYQYDPARGFFNLATFTAAGAFSPNLNKPPYSVDFPLDSRGRIIPEIYARWEREMPLYLAERAANTDRLAIFFDCGTEDELGFYPMNDALHDGFEKLGLGFTYETYHGGHMDQIIERARVGLAWLDSVMANPLPAAPKPFGADTPVISGDFVLGQSYPNPFNPQTRIAFELRQPGMVNLTVYNTLGHQVEALVYGPMTSGNHTILFNGRDLPSGVYIYRLEVNGRSDHRKMLLLK